MVLFLVDAHLTYQAGLSMSAVASEGYSGVIVKASQGCTGYLAPSGFDTWIAEIRAAGMVPGAYHWLNETSGVTQANRFVDRLTSVGGVEGMICAVDCEDSDNPATLQVLTDFITTFQSRTSGHPLLVYSGNWWWTSRGWDISGLGVHLWDSRYVSGTGTGSALYAKVPATWWVPRYSGITRTTLLQFSSTATVDGQAVDVSAFEGGAAELAALTTSTAVAATMAATVAVEEDNMPYLVSLDGKPEIFLSDGIYARHVASSADRTIADFKTLSDEGSLPLGNGAAVRGVSNPTLIGRVLAPVPAGWEDYAADTANTSVSLSDAQLGSITTAASAAVAASLSAVLSAAGAAGDALGVLNDTVAA